MATDAAILDQIQGLLAQQGKVGRPVASVCSAVASLKDLCELNSAAAVDWRRGATGQQASRGFGGGGGGQTLRPIFRNSSGTSIASQQSGAASSPVQAQSPSTGRSPFTPAGVTPSPPARYQSMFKNSAKPVEDKILNNIILSKLNKFSTGTYNDIRDFLYQILGSGDEGLVEMVREFMTMVFKKAAREEVFCPLYAKLLAEISSRYKVILEEMHKLQANYLEIFDDVEEPEGGEDYEAFLAKNKDKQYRQGYSQFLAELAGLEILELSNLEQTFQKIFELMLKFGALEGKKALLEEYADCLLRMSRVLKKRGAPFFIQARGILLRNSAAALEELHQNREKYVSLSPKARFILMDVKDNLSGL
jgi:hypothetical protein